MSKINKNETITETLTKLANNANLSLIVLLDSKGNEEWHTGRIYLRQYDDGKFNIFATNSVDLLFKAEDVIRLETMTEIFDKEA